jgi:hypothetical protein
LWGQEVIELLRKLHNEELHNLYFSPNIINVMKPRRVRWAAHVSCTETKNAYNILVGILKERYCRWEDIMEAYGKEIGCEVWARYRYCKIGFSVNTVTALKF